MTIAGSVDTCTGFGAEGSKPRRPKEKEDVPQGGGTAAQSRRHPRQSAELEELGRRVQREYDRLQPKRRLLLLSEAETAVAWRRALRARRKGQPKRGIRCQICKTRVNDRKSLQDHWRSRHHIKPDGSTYYCALCKLTFNSERQEQQHNGGKRHLKALRKLRLARANQKSGNKIKGNTK